MLEKPYCSVLSNHISTDFPELRSFILKNYAKQITYRKNTIIQPIPKEWLMYMTTGSIKSYMCDENGDERLVYILLADTIVTSTIHDYFLKTLITQEPVSAYYIERDRVFTFLQQDKNYISKYNQILHARYGALLQQALSVNHCSAKYKVYSFISQIAQKYGSVNPAGQIVISNFPTCTDIASITGVHRSNATSYINELKAQDILTREKSQLIIKDMAGLQKIIQTLNACKN